VRIEAHRKRGQFRGTTDAECAAWLREMLVFNPADALRHLGRVNREAGRERSQEQELEESSICLGSWLAARQISPSEHAIRRQRALRVAGALQALAEANREALVLRYYEGLSLDEISARLGRTPAAVAGLLKRGLKQLRATLTDGSER
jgi:RNA polymerase sigma-70 factor (ECF subfamily)